METETGSEQTSFRIQNTSLASPASQNVPERLKAARPSYPAIVHAAVFSAFVLPIALLPYFAARRHVVFLRRTVERLEKDTQHLKRSLGLAVSAHESTTAELRRLQGLASDALRETAELGKQAVEREADRRASDEAIRTDLRKLLEETQHSRTQAASLRALGASLADVAAFIEEVELDFGMETQGKDRRGIERLRLLALRMQSLPQQHAEKVNSKATDQQT